MNHGFCSRSTGATEARLGDLMSPHPTHLNLPNRVSEIFDAHPLQSH